MDFIFLFLGVPYQLEQLANNQPKVSAFFAAQNRLVAEDALNIMDPSLKGGTLAGVPVKDGEQINRQFEDRDCQIEEPSSSSGKSSEVRMAEPINTEDGSSISNELPSSPSQFSVLVKDNQNESKSPAPSVAGPSNPHHSTLEDPNFVENYFKVPMQKDNYVANKLNAFYLFSPYFLFFVDWLFLSHSISFISTS